MNRVGFLINDMLELEGWQELEINEDLRFETNPDCPADGEQLKVIVALTGLRGDKQIRVGCCSACGYVGYIDRPAKEWIRSFYKETWDEASASKTVAKIERIEKSASQGYYGKPRPAITLAQKLLLDKNRPVLEIGCGYGKLLAQLSRVGFKNLIGLEPSPHRAEVVGKAFEFEVLTSAFEDPTSQDQLKKSAPFGLIYSHHVLEHTIDPAQIINLASKLQGLGDYLILSLPNLVGEPSMGVLMFLPHLHSFTLESLRQLLARDGYRVLDSSLTNQWDLNIVAIREERTIPKPNDKTSCFESTLDKFIKGLALNRSYSSGFRRLWWETSHDRGGQVPYFKNNIFECAHWRSRQKIMSIHNPRSLLVTNLPPGQNPSASPIEIQFASNIKIFYK